MLPEGWSRCRLGDLMAFRNGLNYTRNESGECIKVVGVSDFRARTVLDGAAGLDTVALRDRVGPQDLLQAGDLLFVRSNGNKALVGRCLFVARLDEPVTFSGFTIRGRVTSPRLDPAFASELMRTARTVAQMHLGGSGTNISNLSQDILQNVEVCLPGVGEQRRIVRVLATWREAIDATDNLLENARREKHDLMQALLSGRVAALQQRGAWEQVEFDDVFERVARKNDEGSSNVLTISAQHGLVSQRDFFHKNVASEDLSHYTYLSTGDFAYNKSASAGYPVGAIKPLVAHDSGVVSSLYICFRQRSDAQVDADFYRHYFEAGMLNEPIGFIAQEGARNHGLLNVSVKDFFKLPLHLPPLPVQRRIAEVLGVAEDYEHSVAAQARALRDELGALREDLLSGQRRLRPVEEPGEPCPR
ncbi:restriction endonuclease subunit S [Hydrogenophaga crocea]|uniref:Restriction endonuclease subunit S n=1 Tax=Hydrogenophaga crocea TaxID=2716225 RepID=A0A6G8IKZ7_9BURK|nr:restriction endonuclease subunit S [Hydrogenophaga crocea]QIM53789.1 restriction endonuclease subunit S [Hydrogenophaga crocea]